MTGSHNKRVIHTVCDAHHMHEGHHNDGKWVPTTQHSVGESKQQRGAHGGFVHASRSPRSAPLWHRRHRTHSARGRGHIATDTRKHTQKWEEYSVQQRPQARTPNHTRHNSGASW
ncbi:hypothetical protein TcCL_Unassigned04823 [Trypanosoma cruzi]|nr:hypothetical protein TcCL_Unassigned04823 [Trypanosoma cruzi]